MKKKLLNGTIILIAIVLLLGINTSCKKSKEKKIVGSWEHVPMTNIAKDSTETWTFYDGEQLIITEVDTGGNAVYDTATYIFNEKFLKYYIQFDGLNLAPDGNYHIEKLNKKNLIIQCQHPNARFEFVKK